MWSNDDRTGSSAPEFRRNFADARTFSESGLGDTIVSDKATLPQDVRQYLGQKLRATYLERQEKPAYLGDPALPRTFDEQIYRLSILCSERERAGRHGLAAVAAAIADAKSPVVP